MRNRMTLHGKRIYVDRLLFAAAASQYSSLLSMFLLCSHHPALFRSQHLLTDISCIRTSRCHSPSTPRSKHNSMVDWHLPHRPHHSHHHTSTLEFSYNSKNHKARSWTLFPQSVVGLVSRIASSASFHSIHSLRNPSLISISKRSGFPVSVISRAP